MIVPALLTVLAVVSLLVGHREPKPPVLTCRQEPVLFTYPADDGTEATKQLLTITICEPMPKESRP